MRAEVAYPTEELAYAASRSASPALASVSLSPMGHGQRPSPLRGAGVRDLAARCTCPLLSSRVTLTWLGLSEPVGLVTGEASPTAEL